MTGDPTMTPTPTAAPDALVEKVARAICLAEYGDETIHGDERCCQAGGVNGCCIGDIIPIARAALSAIPAGSDEGLVKALEEARDDFYELANQAGGWTDPNSTDREVEFATFIEGKAVEYAEEFGARRKAALSRTGGGAEPDAVSATEPSRSDAPGVSTPAPRPHE